MELMDDNEADRLRAQVEQLTASRDQKAHLVRLIVWIGSDLDLAVTLRRIVEAAVELTDAGHGALGIRAADGTLSSFVCVGMDDAAAARLSEAPTGDGPLLAVPITVREADFGTLFLVHERPDQKFSTTEEETVRTLAEAATAAIDNARLFELERESARWMKASREITNALLSGDPQMRPLQLIVNRALELANAEQAILLVPHEADLPADEVDSLVVAATAGRYTSDMIGRQIPMSGSTTGSVARSGLPLITQSFQYPIEGFTDLGDRSAIVIPLIADDAVLGVIAVARGPHQPAFDSVYLQLVTDFARHATVALAVAAGRSHAINQELAQADTVDDAVRAAADELRRRWRARRVLAVTFPAPQAAALTAWSTPQVVTVGEPASWSDLTPETRQMLGSLRTGDLLTPHTPQAGTAAIALQHPDGVLVVWIELAEKRPFTLEDQTLLSVLAGRLGQGLQRVHQVDVQRETALALQHAILGPAVLPDGFVVRYQAASPPLQVGGDWYDIVDLDDGRIALIVGDCVGHGLAAAAIMGQMRSACRALLFDRPSPNAVLAGMDRFASKLPGARCTTAVCAILDPETGDLVYSTAGHPPPVLVTTDGSIRMLDDAHTIALGIRADWPRPQSSLRMPASSTLALYSDGLVERRRIPLEQGISLAAQKIWSGQTSRLEDLADDVMAELAPTGGYQDDVVLLLYRHPAPLELAFPADVSQLATARSALRKWLKRARLAPEQTMDVLVAAGEAVCNAIEHGHRHSPGGEVSMSATVVHDRIQLTVIDSGTWKEEVTATPTHRGRGISMMRGLMQDVTIHRSPAGTTVRLSARIAP